MSVFGDSIIKHMTASSETIGSLSKKLDVDPETVKNAIYCPWKLNLRILYKFSKYLDIPVMEVINVIHSKSALYKSTNDDYYIDHIEELIRSLNLSRRKLAAHIGVHPYTVHRWITGEATPTPVHYRELKRLLEMRKSYEK